MMRENSLWQKAKNIQIQISNDILPGFDIGFDSKIPSETQKELRNFVDWVENNFNIPVTLWVDFEYKHYLVKRDGKRVGYLFYWSDFSPYPVFQNKTDIPEIKLPVRTEYSTMDEILGSFIEAVTDYFAWICNVISEDYELDEEEKNEILQAYLNSKKQEY